MALTVSAFTSTTLDYKIVKETASTSTPVNNVTGASGSLYSISVTNAASQPVYVKLVDSTSSVPGTTAPSLMLKVANGTSLTWQVPGGVVFANGFSFWAVQLPGVGDSTAPSGGNVAVVLVTS